MVNSNLCVTFLVLQKFRYLLAYLIVDILVMSDFGIPVQLVPGTEVAVAPKMRSKRVGSSQDMKKQSSLEEQLRTRALLRVQASDKERVHIFKFKDFDLGVVLTTVAFVHPDTAKKFSFDNLQLVTLLPRLPPYGKLQNGKDNNPRKLEENDGVLTKSTDMGRHTVVRILFSDSVARGHIMLSRSLRLFLQAGLHSCK